MGTHPIFESDFDCLTETSVKMSDGKVANQQSLQVATMKENMNEYKFVIACIDQVLNTPDPIKTAIAHGGLYTAIYAILKICNPSVLTLASVLLGLFLIVETFIGKFNEKVFANKPFTEDHEARFHASVERLVGLKLKFSQFVSCMISFKAALTGDSPYRFLTFALPTLCATAYIGKKVAMTTIIWLVLMSECVCMVPQFQEKITEVKGKINGMIQKKKAE